MASAKNSRGFTLLELMISISIIGLMIFILMAVLRLGFRSVEAGEKKIDSLERVRACLNIIEGQVQSAIPLGYEEKGEKKYYFKGEANLLEVATNYSIWEGERGYVVVSYQVANDDQGKPVLLAAERRVGLENKREIKLLDQFDRLSFEYFYKDPTEEEGMWVEQWTETTFQPEKIRVNLAMGGKALSLILPMKATGALAAVQPPQTPRSPLADRESVLDRRR